MELELETHNFFRCHKSFLVNLKQIEYLKEGVISIYSDNIPVSKHN
ncbi:LytTR family transcriptional regulator [Clostridioides sp. ES-S-0006-03]|nr:LytTR family transcriptional regulator [Clostridioides sp. ES-S-0006-03]